MRKWFIVLFWLLSWSVVLAGRDYSARYFLFLSELEFEKAKHVAEMEEDSVLRFEMSQLADMLFYEGQVERKVFKITSHADSKNVLLYVVNTLTKGYADLFYDHVKGNAYRSFYLAYQKAKNYDNPFLIKACLFALLKYYNSEVGQNKVYHLPYLERLESIQSNATDHLWVTIYKMIFLTQSFQQLEAKEEYFKLATELDGFEHSLNSNSPMLTYLFYEKALQLDVQKKIPDALIYYRKTIRQAGKYPFLQYHRFNAALKLMLIGIDRKQFDSAQYYLNIARHEINMSDTLKSDYVLNLHSAFLMRAKQKYDSAFGLLWKGYLQVFQLDFRENTLEINRLNVELETREKENANLQLRENRTWLITALAGVALLFLASYLAYTNQRNKNRMQSKEKEVQAMRLEKVLKDQEIFGIDAMLEGQEKERQRMAGDLHDNLGSLLATVKLHFQNIKARKDLEESEREMLLQKTDDLLEEAYQKVRGMAHAGNAGVNAQEGLLPAIKNFASKVSILNRLEIDVEEHGMNSRLENSMEITVFRIIQELITNIIKHAGASEVVINLTHYEDAINLMVEDNGNGFDISKIKPSEGMGLHSIQKKIENLGGRVTIDSIAQKGTTVIIDIPLT